MAVIRFLGAGCRGQGGGRPRAMRGGGSGSAQSGEGPVSARVAVRVPTRGTPAGEGRVSARVASRVPTRSLSHKRFEEIRVK